MGLVVVRQILSVRHLPQLTGFVCPDRDVDLVIKPQLGGSLQVKMDDCELYSFLTFIVWARCIGSRIADPR